MAAKSYQLSMRTGPIPGKVFNLGKNELTIGRDISNDIVISDIEVSRKHARLLLQADGFVIEDMGSTNGTFVNGQRLLGPHTLRPGEIVMLGENVSLIFEPAYDVNATVASTAAGAPTPPPAAVYAPPRSAESQPAAQVYPGQIPADMADLSLNADFAPEEKPAKKTWLWIGCGCLIVLIIAAVIGGIIFDAMNLYCTPPFNAIFYCP
ncbi:MAG: FHA domain-containing protein [Anaerolineaceae bacterium]